MVAGVVIARNLDSAVDALGLSSLLTKAPAAIASVDALILDKWVLATSTLIVGITIGDWIVRRSLSFEQRPERLPLAWLSRRTASVRRALLHPNTYGRLFDMPLELATLDQALTTHGFPSLPSIDPASNRIGETVDYLTVIGKLSPETIDRARARATVLVATLAQSDTSPPAPPLRASRLREALKALVEPR
ncbi:hypothetical protein ACFSC3_08015 [Sphingomonas floccifaciens]|uniref:DUF4129 domain-containing protein n=1 Tax=Sphingomonas floccifaciens TaxID=1844115 RepID=A0ABW4ND71_9SPHN